MTNSTTTRNTINLILTILMIVTMIGNSFAKGVQFETSASYQEILHQAQAENKPIFLDFYTTWCGPCRWMDQDVFQLEVVGALFNENFVSVKVNAERGEGPALAKKFGVTSFPTLIYLNSNGEVVKQQLGMTTATKVMNQATEVMSTNASVQPVQTKPVSQPTPKKKVHVRNNKKQKVAKKKSTKKAAKTSNQKTTLQPEKTVKESTAPTKTIETMNTIAQPEITQKEQEPILILTIQLPTITVSVAPLTVENNEASKTAIQFSGTSKRSITNNQQYFSTSNHPATFSSAIKTNHQNTVLVSRLPKHPYVDRKQLNARIVYLKSKQKRNVQNSKKLVFGMLRYSSRLNLA